MPNTPVKELKLLPGPKTLEAIGRVTVQWAALEAELDRVLFWASDPDDATAADTLKHRSIGERFRLLKEILVRDHSSHPGTHSLIGIIDDALSLKGERDRIIHNDYAAVQGDNRYDPDPSRLLLSAWRSQKKHQDWKVNSAKINAVAKKINAVLVRECGLQFEYGSRIGNSVRMDAWRHKSRLEN